jgi:pimeloyl-ACP methyl ester carboxylesterase
MSVAGHSLGGHLAMMMSRLAPDMVNSVYTYNAPGFDTSLRDATYPPLTSGGFFDLLQGVPVQPITGQIGTDWDAAIMVHFDVAGDVVHGIGNTPGESQIIFSESTNQGAIDAHLKEPISDALAVYDILNMGNTNLGLGALTPVIEAASDRVDNSLEAVVNALDTLFNGSNAVEVVPGDRDQLYTRIQVIRGEQAFYPFASLTSLHDDQAPAIETAARSDKGFLYALEHLNPFAVVGDDSLYTTLEPADFSDTYLEDRSRLLKDKLSRAIQDDTASQDFGPSTDGPVHYIDKDSNYDVRILPGPPGLTTICLRALLVKTTSTAGPATTYWKGKAARITWKAVPATTGIYSASVTVPILYSILTVSAVS